MGICMLRNNACIVKLYCLTWLDGVFFYPVIGDAWVGEPFLAQLLLPGVCEDAVEGGAESYIKNPDVGRCVAGSLERGLKKLLQQMFNPAADVYVHGLCVGPVGGVVGFIEAGELQSAAAVCAGGYPVLHLSLVYNAKLGIMV